MMLACVCLADSFDSATLHQSASVILTCALPLPRPLFRGSSDVDQLGKIFDVVGVPSVEDWPQEVALPQSAFSPRPPQPIGNLIPDMDELGKSLILQFLAFNPAKRISAFAALTHPYFQSVDSDSKSVYAQPIASNKPTMEESAA
nr:cyclin-dependent kinase 6-like [Salvelinus alpinus]